MPQSRVSPAGVRAASATRPCLEAESSASWVGGRRRFAAREGDGGGRPGSEESLRGVDVNRSRLRVRATPLRHILVRRRPLRKLTPLGRLGLLGAVLLAALGILPLSRGSLLPATRAPAPLSTGAKADLRVWAQRVGPTTLFFTWYGRSTAAQLAASDRDEIDDSRIDNFAELSCRWSDGFVRDFQAKVESVASVDQVDRSLVKAYLASQLREATVAGVPRSGFAMPGVAPLRGRILGAPCLCPPPGGQNPEQALEATIQHLLEVLAGLPPQSNGAKGVKNAILAHRQALIPFDTKPIAVAFTAPTPGVIVNFIPVIEFTMTDSGSGPAPASRQLIALRAYPKTPLYADKGIEAWRGLERGVWRGDRNRNRCGVMATTGRALGSDAAIASGVPGSSRGRQAAR